MGQKLNAKPKHIDELINYTMSMHEESAGLDFTPKDITKVIDGDINWTVNYENKTSITEKCAVNNCII